MIKSIHYNYLEIETCNMCGSKTKNHIYLGKRLNQSQGKKPRKKKGITANIYKCNSCNLIYSNPMPYPDNIESHYGIPPESYWKESYFKVNPNYFKGELQILSKLIIKSNKMKSLDIGAGIGKSMISLSNFGFDAYGFEPSKPFYNRAISKMGITPNKLKNTSIENAEYPENEFDFITFGAVLEHLYNPSLAIQKALKWCKPNGVIHIEVPSSKWLINKIANIYYKMIGTNYVANISPMHEPFHLYEFGLNSFIEHSKKNNYEIAHYDYYVCDTYMPKFLDFVLKPYMKWTNSGMQLCVWLRKKSN